MTTATKTKALRLRDWQVRALRDDRLSLVVWPINQARIPERDRSVSGFIRRCPFGEPGTEFYVQETWAEYIDEMTDDTQGLICYSADESAMWHDKPGVEDVGCRMLSTDFNPIEHGIDILWRSSTQMPEWASRFHVINRGVTVKPLQEVTPQQAMAAGIENIATTSSLYGYWTTAFARQWDKDHGAGSWEANPFCWFMTIERNAEA